MAERVSQPHVGASYKTRNQAISDELSALLTSVGDELDVYFEVYSGGQTHERDPAKKDKPGGWTGSHRHDHGGAADVDMYRLVDGKKQYLRWDDGGEGEKVWREAVKLSVAGGATGLGAGKGYMGGGRVHIGFGAPATWGGKKGVAAPAWLQESYSLGKKTPPLNIPSLASETATAYAPQPATKSPALAAITQATGGIPSAYNSPSTPQQVASLYEGILPQPKRGLPNLVGGGVPGQVSPTIQQALSGERNGLPVQSYDFGNARLGLNDTGLGALRGKSVPPAAMRNPTPQGPSAMPANGMSPADRRSLAPSSKLVGSGKSPSNHATRFSILPRPVLPGSMPSPPVPYFMDDLTPAKRADDRSIANPAQKQVAAKPPVQGLRLPVAPQPLPKPQINPGMVAPIPATMPARIANQPAIPVSLPQLSKPAPQAPIPAAMPASVQIARMPQVPKPYIGQPLPPPTDAQRFWEENTNFGSPRSLPGVGMPKFADIKALVGPQTAAPIPRTMSPALAMLRQSQQRVAQVAPIPAPVAAMHTARQKLNTPDLRFTQQQNQAFLDGKQQVIQAGPYTYTKGPQGYVRVQTQQPRPAPSGPSSYSLSGIG